MRRPNGERLAAEKDVLRDIEVIEERRLLVDDRNACILTVVGTVEVRHLTVVRKGPTVESGTPPRLSLRALIFRPHFRPEARALHRGRA